MPRSAFLLVLLLFPIGLAAEEPAAEEPAAKEPAAKEPAAKDPAASPERAKLEAERARHLERMRKVASSIRVLADPKQTDSAVKLKDEPVLRYSDSTRLAQESTMWIWSGGGRPTAILAVEYYPMGPKGPRWLYEIASLSTQPIAAECEGYFRWAAKAPGLKLQPLPDAPPPADKETRRLAQMKELRSRFTAYEKATVEGRIELRAVATPLVRYSSPPEDLVDGAIFALASGTNPEVLLVLEAQGPKGKVAWHYALVHMTGEAATVQL
ncbi:MAG TPA: hypothetical protein VKH44_15190, partial [Pirellulaceae bacterium]|nr:hypothetical protein [Pirellulaceae bacterium]